MSGAGPLRGAAPGIVALSAIAFGAALVGRGRPRLGGSFIVNL